MKEILSDIVKSEEHKESLIEYGELLLTATPNGKLGQLLQIALKVLKDNEKVV